MVDHLVSCVPLRLLSILQFLSWSCLFLWPSCILCCSLVVSSLCVQCFRWSVCLRTTLCWSSAARHFAFWPYFSGRFVFILVSRNARRLCAFRFVVCICSFASRFGWLCLSGHFPLSWVYRWSSAATKLMAWARVQRLMQFFSCTFSFINSCVFSMYIFLHTFNGQFLSIFNVCVLT